MASPIRPEPKYFLSQFGDADHYRDALFPDANGVNFLGEKSTSYYESISVPKRIKQTLPEAKILMIMRDPVERALSNYRFSKSNGFESRTAEEVFLSTKPPIVSSDKTSVDPFNYLERGNYLKFIKRYLEDFEHQDFLPILFERLVNSEIEEQHKIWRFLNLDSTEIKSSINYRNQTDHESYSGEVRSFLANYYKSLNQQLADYLKMDLSCWGD
jgi:hypothetical protein